MNGKQLATALKRGNHVYGTAILSPSALWPKMISSVGLDFVFIDMEHTPLNRETVSCMCHMYAISGLAPLVRIPAPDPYQASMVLDGGAHGVIAPYIETADQVRSLVGAVKHGPVKGKKLAKHLVGKQSFEPALSDYICQRNEENVLVINVESVAAIETLDDILAVEGLDAILIGPHDLSCSLGIAEQYRHSLFRRSVETIIEKASTRHVGVGVHMWDAVGFDQEILWARKGANVIMHSSDMLVFRNAMQKDIERIKASLAEEQDAASTEGTILR